MTSQRTGVFSFLHLFKGSALYGSSDIVVAVIRFALIAVYTRIMSPVEFGLYSIIMASLTLAVVFLPLGIPSSVMLRVDPIYHRESKIFKDCAISFLFPLCLLCGAAFYIASVFAFPESPIGRLAPWLLLQVTAEIVGSIPKVSLRIKEKIAEFSVAKVVRIVCMGSLLFVLLRAGVPGLSSVIIAEAVASVLECLLCMAFDRYIPAKPRFSSLGSLLGVGIPLMLVASGVFCIDLSDRYIVYLFLGKQATGYYAAAAKVALAGSFFAEAFNSMWFPYYLRIGPKTGEAIAESLKRFATKLIVLFSIVISLFMLVLPFFVKLRIFGRYFITPEYHAVTVLIAPLTLAYFFKTAFYVSSAIMIAGGKNWGLARIVYIAAFVNIAANVLFATLRPWPDQFHTLAAIAFMTSVSYALCMIVASKSSGLFPLRFWVTSRYAPLCAAALCLAFAPASFSVRLGAWTCIACVAGWMFFKSKEKTGPYL